jgi:uncharacterized protein (TIGR03067 family)
MTRLRWFTVSSVLLAVAGLVHGGGDTQSKLDGTWVLEKEGKKVEIRFAKGDFTINMNGKTIKGAYKTDPKKKPNELDILIKDDNPKIDGKTALCIYEVKGDTLKWAANDPGRGNPRLKDFPENERFGGDYIYLVLKRAGK